MDSVTIDGQSPSVPETAGLLRVDEAKIRSHLDEVVRNTVKATLNQLLDQEADRVGGAGRVRAVGGAAGHAGREHAEAADQGG